MSAFIQEAPQLTNQFRADRALLAQLERLCPPDMLEAIRPELDAMGERAVKELAELGWRAEQEEPRLVHYNAWGQRVDRLEVSSAWKEMLRMSAETGLVGTAYERKYGAHSRVLQLALVHLFGPSSAVATCPLAMTDGAARTMETHAKDEPFAKRVLEHLTTRDPDKAWTAGQWMTEKEGGSDVGRSSTQARFDGVHWRLHGTKYFTSSTTSECALTLARPEGAGPGSRALAMFYVEPWLPGGESNNVLVRRLKDKLGTRALPTAELELEGTIAHPIGDTADPGVRKIATVLNICRYWNTMSAAHSMRRAVALAIDYAHRREAFGHPLVELPLHVETLAAMQVEYEGALAIALRLAELIGKQECGETSETEDLALRLLTPVAKLMTGKQAVAVASEGLEAFGGAGYMEDTGIARILRDAQVLPIWEGTTNVLSLDTLRSMARENALGPFIEDGLARLTSATDARFTDSVGAVRGAFRQIGAYAAELAQAGRTGSQLVARHFAMSLARTYTAALLVENAAAAHARNGDTRPAISAQRWIESGICSLLPLDLSRLDEARSLLV